MPYFVVKKNAVQYVVDQLAVLRRDSRWIMTIQPVKLGAYSVQIVTAGSSDDYAQEQVASFFSQTQVNT